MVDTEVNLVRVSDDVQQARQTVLAVLVHWRSRLLLLLLLLMQESLLRRLRRRRRPTESRRRAEGVLAEIARVQKCRTLRLQEPATSGEIDRQLTSTDAAAGMHGRMIRTVPKASST